MRGTGLALALLSASTFGTSGSFATALVASGWTPAAAVTVRVGLAALVLTVPAVLQLRGRWHQLRRGAPVVLAYGAFAVAGSQLGYFNAVEHLSVGVALLLEYLGIVLVVGWMWLRHGQRPGRLTVAGAAVAIAGLVLVLDLTGSQRLSPVGLAWGLLAMLGLVVYYVLSAQGEQPLPPLPMAWAGMIVGTLVLLGCGAVGLLPMHATTHQVTLADHRMSWLVPVLGLSLFAAAIAYCAGIGAARLLGARLASFVGLAEVLFGVLFAWLLLEQLPTAMQLGGGALIVAGVALVRLGEPTAAADDADVPARAVLTG